MAPGQKKIKILFVEVTSQMGGVEVTTLQVASGMDHQLFDPVVCVPEVGDLTNLCKTKGVNAVILPLPAFPSVSIMVGDHAIANPLAIIWDGALCLYAALRLARFIKVLQFDLVCTKGLFAHFYGGIASKILNIPCVWHVQEIVESRRAGGFFLFMLRFGARLFARRIIADAKDVTSQFDGLRKTPGWVVTIYNGVDLEAYQPRENSAEIRESLKIPQDAFVIGCVARLMPGKGQHVLIRAFQSIANEHPDMMLVLVGKGLFDQERYEKSLHELVADLDLENRVTFTGWVEHTSTAFNAFDIAVHASVGPDSPLSVLEAMSSGCPLILTAVPGCKEMVKDGEALLIPPDDADAMRAAMLRLYEDAALRKELSCAGRAAAEERFSLERSTRQIEAVFEELIPKMAAR